MTALERARLDRGAQYLHALGPRAVAELLVALTARVGGRGALDELLEDYARLSPALVRQIGADRMPPRNPRALPPDLMRGAA